MESEGWNYENAKTEGKNLFIFRDTSHLITDVQEKILTELDLAINRGFFHLLFIEGCAGNFQLEYDLGITESDIKRVISQRRGKYSAVQVLSYRLQEAKNRSVIIHGVDNRRSLDEQISNAQRAAVLTRKLNSGTLTQLEAIEMDNIISRDEVLTNDRTIDAVKTMTKVMDEWRVNTAGVVFGEGHYNLLADELKKQKIGYVSYYPGKQSSKVEDIVNYATKMR